MAEPIRYEIVRASYNTGRVLKVVARDIPFDLIDSEVRAWQADPRLRSKHGTWYYAKRLQERR
jgi:hypothetical protein